MTILDEIVERVTARLPAEKQEVPPVVLAEQLQTVAPPASFYAALRAGRDGAKPAVIAEVKKGSPSRGVIRENFPVKELALSLEAGGAAALSVLTERDYFFGSPAFLRTAVDAVSIPVLRKDFVVDAYQIDQARAWGASAVLLIAAALTPADFKRLLQHAQLRGLDVLAETHTEDELKMVLDAGVEIVGVNSRDLKTFRIDLALAERMLGLIPDRCVRVAESGIKTADDMRRLRNAGADAFLIGETVMRGDEPGMVLKNLLEKV